MQKELHIWMNLDYYPYKEYLYVTLNDTEKALNNEYTRVDTTQTHVCSTTWLVKGYRIFVHMIDGETVEIVLGNNNINTDRDIGVRHNLERLLLANEFGKATIG